MGHERRDCQLPRAHGVEAPLHHRPPSAQVTACAWRRSPKNRIADRVLLLLIEFSNVGVWVTPLCVASMCRGE